MNKLNACGLTICLASFETKLKGAFLIIRVMLMAANLETKHPCTSLILKNSENSFS